MIKYFKQSNVFYQNKVSSRLFILFYSQLVEKDYYVKEFYKSVLNEGMNEISNEGDSLELASEIGLICKRMGPKNLDGSDAFSFDFYHQLILEYFAALQFNQMLETSRIQLQKWYCKHYKKFDS